MVKHRLCLKFRKESKKRTRMEKKKKFDFLSKCLRLLKYLSKYNPYANMKYEEMLMRLKEGKKRGKDGIC